MINKKAVSLMVGYTLLVVIALGLSIAVYAYLKLYVPPDLPECPNGMSLTVEDFSCDKTSQQLTVTLANTGLFNVSRVFVRLSPRDKSVGWQVNIGQEDLTTSLAPGDAITSTYGLPSEVIDRGDTEFSLGIQPSTINENGFLVPCEGATVSYPLVCEFT